MIDAARAARESMRSGRLVPAGLCCGVLLLVLLLVSGPVSGTARAQAMSPDPAGEQSAGEQGAQGQATPDASLSVPPAPTRKAPSGASGPGLDALLQLPQGYGVESGPRVAGTSEAEWRRRFAKARAALTEAEQQLAQTKRELDEEAGSGGASQWAVAPPGASNSGQGGGANNSPLSFRLRQALRSHREEVEEKQRALRDLGIEADLAGVPPSWRGEDTSGNRRPRAGPSGPALP